MRNVDGPRGEGRSLGPVSTAAQSRSIVICCVKHACAHYSYTVILCSRTLFRSSELTPATFVPVTPMLSAEQQREQAAKWAMS